MKNETRQNRGTGQRRRVTHSTKIPKNWNDFLKHSENKVELFAFLGQQTILVEAPGQVVSTLGNSIISRTPIDGRNLSPCDHEEADTRIFLHIYNAMEEGHHKVLVRTVDTDVVVLAVSLFSKLKIEELWIAFGVGKLFRYIAAMI